MAEDEAQTDDLTEDSGSGGKKKKLLFILLPVLVILAGAGGGLYMSGALGKMMGGGGEEESHEEEVAEDTHHEEKKVEHAPAPSHASADSHGGGHGEATGIAFLELPSMQVNLVNDEDDGSLHYFQLTVVLEFENHTDKATAEELIPRIRDRIQTFLKEMRITELRGSAGIYRLKIELLSRINDVIYPVEAKDVLIQSNLFGVQ